MRDKNIPSAQPNAAAAAVIEAISQDLPVADLRALWSGRTESWASCPEVYVALASQLLAHGESLIAYDVTSSGLRVDPKRLELRQLMCLALAQSGAATSANEIARNLYHEGHRDPKTLGLLGRTYKDLASHVENVGERQRQLQNALVAYRRAYVTTQSGWPGINTAAISLLLGHVDEARAVAAEVLAGASAQLTRQVSDAYWLEATAGEAALILGQVNEAEDHYCRAVARAQSRLADIATTRRQARLIARHLELDTSRLDRILSIPRVVVFSGHMIDRPERASERFPPHSEAAVANEIRRRLGRLEAGFGYASAACGSDILFIEALLERGGQAHLFLPHAPTEFRKRSVDFANGWGERFDRVLAAATCVVVANPNGVSEDPAEYEYLNLMRDGLAILRARSLESEAVGLTVWDGRKGDDGGGTASAVANWKRRRLAVEVIDPLPTPSRPAEPDAGGTVRAASESPRTRQHIRALLFADVVGYSKLADQQVPLFVRHFMGRIATLLGRFRVKPLMKNTWGDAIYLVFETIEDAFEFSVALLAMVRGTSWQDLGLPAELNLRIGLHAGPVFALKDPIIDQVVYTGAHVSRAARIEPIAPPGEIYASEGFAAVAVAKGVQECLCVYVGEVPQAKGYGTYRTYLVQRRA